MLRVTLRGAGVPAAVLGTGDRLMFGRAPGERLDALDPDSQLRLTTLALPRTAPHVSRVVGEVVVGEEMVRLRWHGSTEAQLSSLFDAPGGARRVALAQGMSAFLDEGENHVLLLRGRETEEGRYTDLVLVVVVDDVEQEQTTEPGEEPSADLDAAPTAPAPRLEPRSREWFVALALAEPWLTGADDYPRPPSNREVYERVSALARLRLEPRPRPAGRRRDPRRGRGWPSDPRTTRSPPPRAGSRTCGSRSAGGPPRCVW